MRLTITIRDAFIRAVMSDVPQIDYESQIHKLVLEDSIEQLPEGLRPFARKEETKRYLEMTYHYFRGSSGYGISSVRVFGEDYKQSDKITKQVEAILAKAKEQSEKRHSLEVSIRSAAYGVTTRKALANLLPEFEKYLPEDEPAAVRTLPAIANIVADFTKAGWPKDKQSATA